MGIFFKKARYWVFALIFICCDIFASSGGDPEVSMTHKMMYLVIQLGIILFMAKLFSLLFEKMKLPGVLGELVAGIIIGPYMLGHVSLAFLGFPHGIFPLAHGAFPISPELYGICTVASIILLFMVGLETDIKMFIKYSLTGGCVGLFGVAGSFIIGDLAGVVFLPMLMGIECTFLSAPGIFLGVISTATSVGITARVLSEKRKIDSPEGTTILAGAVFDDVLGIILLAVGLGIISASEHSGGINWGHIGVIAAKAIGIWLGATIVGVLASHKISFLLKLFKSRTSIAIMALASALILSGLFEEAKLAMIIGAYVMGLALSGTDINNVIREKLEPIYELMVPIFFAVMGMLVNVNDMLSPKVFIFGLIYTVLAILAKVIGCGIPTYFFKFNTLGALRVGFGMLPRGEVALIVAGIGLASGHLSSEIFGVGIMMTLLTTIIAPPILVALFKSDKSGMRIEQKSESIEPLLFEFPSRQTADMLVKIIVRTFEREGFYVHLIDRDANIYQLRKEKTIFTLQQKQKDVIFHCSKEEALLINTCMLEVVAEFEQMMQDLKKPLDKVKIGKNISFAENKTTDKNEGLRKYVDKDLIILNLRGTTKEEVLEELLRLVKSKGLIKNFDEASKAVWDREKSMSTGMQYGVAIPHGRTDSVDRIICAIGLKPEGIDFSSIDGQLSQIFVLTLSPETGGTPYMQFMAMISQMMDKKGREEILAAKSTKELFNILSGGNEENQASKLQMFTDKIGKRKKGLKLKDITKPELINCKLDADNKKDAIIELLNMIAKTGKIDNPDEVLKTVFEREDTSSTDIFKNAAIPHARTKFVDQKICAIGIKKGGIDFGDNHKVEVIALILTPLDQPMHMQLIAGITSRLSEHNIKKLINAKTPEALYKAISM
jgi:Kef-type K+ transport system membrane component KefB/mannitol/fructose-specific phosphotransferase system IIA component (Ntr-type)